MYAGSVWRSFWSLFLACSYTPPNPAIGDAPMPEDGPPAVDGVTDAANTVAPCANPIFDQLFTDTTACAPWGGSFSNSGATITQGGGELDFALVSNIQNGAGCIAPTPVPLPAGGVIVRVPEVVTGGGTFTQLQILKNDSVALGVSGTELRYSKNDGLPVYQSATYDPLAMQWWRLRPAGGAILAEHSADGLTWVNFGSHTTAIENMRVQLIVGTNGGPNSGQSRFTRLVMCP